MTTTATPADAHRIGLHVRKTRMRRGMTQEALGRLLGVGSRTAWKLEHGQSQRSLQRCALELLRFVCDDDCDDGEPAAELNRGAARKAEPGTVEERAAQERWEALGTPNQSRDLYRARWALEELWHLDLSPEARALIVDAAQGLRMARWLERIGQKLEAA